MVKKSPGRKLISPPTLLQDWDTDAEELTSKYWELFLDLLLVAASSAIADQLAANPSAHGILEFVTLYLVVVNGYMNYSPQFTTRFEDSSLSHCAVLFPYFLGLSICTVNASFQTARNFALGSLLQRLVLVYINGTVAHHIERARAFGINVVSATLVNAIILSIGVIMPSFAVESLYIVAALETVLVFFQTRFLTKEQLVPINIEHTKDRLGCLVLIMLGETVVSVSITYRLLQKGSVTSMSRYYWTNAYSFLLIFCFTLLYFHMQPSPVVNGFHISRMRGILLFGAHKLLGMALLSVGVAVRMMVNAACKETPLTPFGTTLMGVSVGSSVLILLSIRALHYAFTGTRSYSPRVTFLFNLWWVVFWVAGLLPFGLIFVHITDPVQSAAVFTGIITSLCVIESAFTHVLEETLTAYQDGDEAETTPLQDGSLETIQNYQTGA